ncbi:MAG: hypothetical protein DLM70_00765, partial [Chloroflexi bacterium]
ALRRLRDDGQVLTQSRQTLAHYLAEWLSWKESALRYRTHVDYVWGIGRINRVLGDKKLSSLTTRDLDLFYVALHREGLSASSTTIMHVILRQALEQAVIWDVIPKNPALRARPPKLIPVHRPHLTHDEMGSLLEVSRGTRWHALWAVMGLGGLRFGEATALKWSDLESNGDISITKQRQHQTGRGMVEIAPKTGTSARSIGSPDAVVSALRRHRSIQAEEKMLFRRVYQDSGLIFCGQRGTPLYNGYTNTCLRRDCLRAGIPVVSSHALRHTMATMMAQLNMHPKVAQEVLGHTKAATTMAVYTHVSRDMVRDAAKRLDALFPVKERERHGTEMSPSVLSCLDGSCIASYPGPRTIQGRRED